MNPAFILEKQIQEYVSRLADETDSFRKSAFFRGYLDTVAKFWQYSCHNQLLIHVQCGGATRVAGFRAWNEMGRRIKAGSKAIKILAPFTKKIVEKNADGLEEERVFTYFVPVNVFDVSQTQGKELPRIEIEVLGENQQGLLKKLIEFCDSKKILIEFKTMDKQLYGYSAGGKIAINSNQSINSQANTLIHEIAHELLHQNANAFSKKEQETQAEAITYIITKHFGLENKSSNYLALHKAEAKQIMQTLAQISETVQEIIGYLETNTAIKGEVSASI